MSRTARVLSLGVSAISLALLAAAGLSSCMAVLESTAPSPTNFERLETGTPRSSVESVLGSPESQEYNRATYEFSRGSMFSPPETTGVVGRFGRGMLAAAGSATWFFLAKPMIVTGAIWQRKGFHGLITIVYGPDGRVIGRSYAAAEALYVACKARRRPEERLGLLCLAANGGYPPAQHAQAVFYELGLFDRPVSVTEAYVWARLAELGGDPRGSMAQQRLAARLDTDQLAGADARYATWSPTPCPLPTTAPEA
jgi:hypothetical protein